jgi:putative NIF3 family GTP cyclohydrolase 1 type 2
MHTNTKKIIKVMENIAPVHLKEDWDNVGLMVGYENKMIENVLVALEVTEAVIDEAVEKNVDMIICHHPLIYTSLKKLVESDPIGRMVLRLIKNEINLYCRPSSGHSKRYCLYA